MEQYTKVAGQSVIKDVMQDRHGNAQGTQYDLAVDGGFAGSTVAVLHLYTADHGHVVRGTVVRQQRRRKDGRPTRT